jgi:hypothetical protein
MLRNTNSNAEKNIEGGGEDKPMCQFCKKICHKIPKTEDFNYRNQQLFYNNFLE